MFLTSADLGDNSLCQSDVLCQLLSETLTHVVIDIVGTEQLLEGLRGVTIFFKNYSHTDKKRWGIISDCLGLLYLGGITHVLGENMTDPVALSHPLPQVGELASLCLDQGVVLPVVTGRGCF